MTKPCEIFMNVATPSGNRKRVKLFSYVALLTKINGEEVEAVRYDGYERKTDVRKDAEKDYPDWKIKDVWRLYDDDFTGEVAECQYGGEH